MRIITTEMREAVNALRNISQAWPEKSFTHAPWPEIAERIKEIYLHREEMELIPQEVRVGSYDTRTPICRKLPIPFTFPWTGFRGLCVASAGIALGCKVMSAILLRIRLQAAPEHLQIHIVDPKKMGADMMALPVMSDTPRLSEQELCHLLQKLDKEIAANDAQEWLCDKLAEGSSTVHRPIHIIAIANWDDLTIRRQNDEWEHSESQKTILRMLETDVAARNGVYFYICSERSESWQLPVLKVQSKVKVSLQPCTPDKQGIGSVKSIDLDLTLPTEDEIKRIHAGFRNYLSGSVEDTDGKGVWLGNASAGLRAIMGTTPQGEPQYFELGIGKGANEDLIEHPVVVVRFVGDNGNRGFGRLSGNRNLRRGGGAPGKGQNKKQSCNAQKDLFHENYLAYPMELSMASSILPQAPFPAPEHFT